MTANELDQFIQQNDWKTAPWEENGDHVIPNKIQYALVASLQDDSLADPNEFNAPYWIHQLAESKARADYRTIHQFDPVPRNKPIAQLLKDYVTKGMKVKARSELKKRVPFVSFDEQKKILCAFFENASVDRQFALRFLDTNWDDFYAPFVEKAWCAFHEMAAARVIIHHFPADFILANRDALATDYNYLQVRLRLPSTFDINKERLSGSAYLYLCARQSIEVPDWIAERLFYQNMLNAIAGFYILSLWHVNPPFKEPQNGFEHNLCDVPTISSMVWSLGMLGKTDILLQFIDFHKTIYPLIYNQKWQDVRSEFDKVGLDLDYSKYDKSILVREQRRAENERYRMANSLNVPWNDSNHDMDDYVDEHVAMKSLQSGDFSVTIPQEDNTKYPF